MIIKEDQDIIKSYSEDASNLPGGYLDRVSIAENYDDVSSFLRECNNSKIPLTISGGGTGTTGGRIPFGGSVLSLEKLDKILHLEKRSANSSITCQAGSTIEGLKKEAEKNNLFYSYDPTEQTATIGGTISTNASGARSFKYGSTRNSVEGIVLYLADGTKIDLKRNQIKADKRLFNFKINGRTFNFNAPSYNIPKTKTSAGYYAADDMDLVDLFVGHEGTLGCIVQADLKLNKKPYDILSCFSFFDKEEDAIDFSREAALLSKTSKGKNVSALSIEYFGNSSLDVIRKKFGNVPENRKAAVFFEQDLQSENDENRVLDLWVGLLEKHGADIKETWVAMTEKERKDLIEKRHHIAEAMNEMFKKNGFPKVTTDLAVPDNVFMEMMKFYKQVLDTAGMQYFLFGHIGDCHIHMNVLPKDKNQYKQAKQIAMSFVKKSISLGGTVSAEHGIGKMRKEYLKALYGQKGIDEMIEVKKTFDPNFILGTGNIFDLTRLHQ